MDGRRVVCNCHSNGVHAVWCDVTVHRRIKEVVVRNRIKQRLAARRAIEEEKEYRDSIVRSKQAFCLYCMAGGVDCHHCC